jgi:hypothetical protein
VVVVVTTRVGQMGGEKVAELQHSDEFMKEVNAKRFPSDPNPRQSGRARPRSSEISGSGCYDEGRSNGWRESGGAAAL